MGYTLTLTDYVKQDASKVIYAELFSEIPTIKYCNIQTGIKTAETINIVSTRPTIQVAACAFNASGTTTFTQRTITVGKSKIDMKWCEAELETKYTSEAMKAGSTYDSLTYQKQIIGDTLQYTATQIEKTIWLGNTASGDQTLKQFDGFVKILTAASLGGTYSGTSWSQANSRTVMLGLAALVVANTDVWNGGATKVKFFMNPAMAQQYRWKLMQDNVGFAGAYQDSNKGKTFVEGTDIEIVEVYGLSGENRIYAIETDNMYFGTDLENEQEKFDVWMSKDNGNELRLHMGWKAGVQVAFPDRIFDYRGV
jgi:hypothetical protein